jgi:hypothetical protein
MLYKEPEMIPLRTAIITSLNNHQHFDIVHKHYTGLTLFCLSDARPMIKKSPIHA